MHDCDVVVVGVGLAGLTAARELSSGARAARIL
jgi:flavin-dependent dehydrogenase